MQAKPRFSHDCGSCEFKGRRGKFDVWFCARCDGGSWIARYSSIPENYASFPEAIARQILTRRDIRPDEAIAAIGQYLR